MGGQNKVPIRKLPTGVPGLDEILGGGLPDFSFNIIGGAPGGGETTLAHQIVFANATPERPALFFTVLGEPALKMLRHQQQFDFFDHAKLNSSIRFINLSQVVLDGDLGAVLAEIIKQVEAANPRIVVVDSFRTVVRKAQSSPPSDLDLQAFAQRLAPHLTSWEATTLLIGEYSEQQVRDNPVFTVADGFFRLSQNIERNAIVRKLQVMKLRGQGSVPGLHTFRITDGGLQCFPRTFGLGEKSEHVKGTRRLSTGVPGLDAIMGGRVPEGDRLLLPGPSGTGKTVLGQHFIDEGLRNGEPGIVAMFEELPDEYARRAASFGIDFQSPRKAGTLEIIYIRPLDLSVDETLYEVVSAVKRTGCKRLVIDSLVGFELALAPGFRTDFRESPYRMIGALTRMGVTILSTVEIEETFNSMSPSNFAVSFLADDLVRLRYVSINGQLRKMMMVVKMRRSGHGIDMVEYRISPEGIVVGRPLRGYRGLLTSTPGPWSPESGQNDPAPRNPTFELQHLCRYFSERSSQPMLAVEGPTCVVRHVNPAFLRLTGARRSDPVGRPFAVGVPQLEANGCMALLDRVFRTGTPECLAEQQHGENPAVYWSYSVWAILGPHERPAGVMIQVTDCTETALFRKQTSAMNEALMLSAVRQQELAEQTMALNARLEAALRDKEYFIAVPSHELRTPLTPVLLAASMLERDRGLDEETRDIMRMIRGNVALDARLIDDLLDTTRME